VSKGRVVGVAGALFLAWMAVYGGEYGTRDWWRMKRELAVEQGAVDSLRAELDSLARIARLLETDPAMQERAAREEFGMIRNGEVLYRIVPADTAGKKAR
jgi:cell division protein FtsB